MISLFIYGTQCLEWVPGYPGLEPLPGYPVNVPIPTGKVREFDVVWKMVTLQLINE